MIVLSVGMPRAGSGWYYNLTNDLMLASGAQDARRIRERYHLESVLTEVNCNIGALTTRRLLMTLVPALLGNTFVIKAHAGPTPTAMRLIRSGLLQATYIYRDPRDALLSAYENGKHAREKGRSNAFAELVDLETAVEFMQEYVHISNAWLQCPGVLTSRYENLLTTYDEEVSRLIGFLKLDRKNEALQKVVDKYRPESPPAEQRGIHFSHGKIGRFRLKMTGEEQESLNTAFSAYLERMGYPL